MEPPFLSVETVDDLIELGVVNMDRLRDLASLPDRSMWINRYVELSRLEYWILKRKLDKLAPGL
ncbi:hypothetical protein EVJ58_g2748 [Rhodofomes roseus]|uniref:Uncharacterized protein n=1 Tax=Rhodofomes roseus TaxID=34475 RepID=A0A4Y9YR68_9APHY|nr:hypothetical protein EVJ58_g2748 [Rhodofomes roseus]